MEQISDIRRGQLIGRALGKLQPVGKEMGVRAGCVKLHSRHAAAQDLAVKRLCRRPADPAIRVRVKYSLPQAAELFPIVPGGAEKGKQLQKRRILPLFFIFLHAAYHRAQPQRKRPGRQSVHIRRLNPHPGKQLQKLAH